MKYDLGDRMKMYEGMEAERRLMPTLPTFARLDGRCFHTFTRGMARPYDVSFNDMMMHLTRFMVEETQAKYGYTQSDEITLMWYSPTVKSEIFFDGRIMKMTSILAAMASTQFLVELRSLPAKWDRIYRGDMLPPVFDCRVWTVPTKEEAANVFLWREQDAVRNSIEAAAQSVYSANQLFKKDCSQLQEMLFQKGINWNDYPAYFKRGTHYQRYITAKKFTTDEIAKLPEKHAARTNPDLMVERSCVRELAMPPFGKVVNRAEVVVDGAQPITETGGVTAEEKG